MRADRLLSIMMILQARGKVTAETLAKELEVSVRTIYRDLTALSAAGVPVFCERGMGGGVALVEEYRTTLTGLNPAEARALFMTGSPSVLEQLGVGQDLKRAMLKLAASLPASRQKDESDIRRKILIDSSWWFQEKEKPPSLETIQEALWQERLLRIRFLSFQEAIIEQLVAPFGLVAKAAIWHLVYGWEGSIRVIRVESILEAEKLDGQTRRPDGFDLAAFWEVWCREYESRPPFVARVRVSPALLPQLRWHLEERYQAMPEETLKYGADGWVTMDLPFDTFANARMRLLGLGAAVEVLEPVSLRKSIQDFAIQILQAYEKEKP